MSVLLGVVVAVGVVRAHVPTYTGCTENCCAPPEAHTTSQVIYLKGSGGLEIHLDNERSPINIADGEILDVDVVFRDRVPLSCFELYIGCGGCVASEDPLVPSSHVQLRESDWQPAVVEPFTQTWYRSVLPEGDRRKFNSRELVGCDQAHFTIRLVDHGNCTVAKGEPVIWAPVIGLAEEFTVLQILEFPLYVLRNHSDTWTGLGWTYWVILFVITPFLLNAFRELARSMHLVFSRYNNWVLDPYPWRDFAVNWRIREWKETDPREVCYEVALYGFIAAMIESLLHLTLAQMHADGYDWAFWVGLFVVTLFAHGVGIAFVCVAWIALRHREVDWVISRGWWAPLEVLTGFSFLFLFGSGFYLGPAGIIVSGCIRFREIDCSSPKTVVAEEQDEMEPLYDPNQSKVLAKMNNDTLKILREIRDTQTVMPQGRTNQPLPPMMGNT